MLEDLLLIRNFNQGIPAALTRIYEKYRRDLLRLATYLLNDENTAEDVLHDVFLNFSKCSGTFRLTGKLKSYLAMCVANRAKNVMKEHQRKHTGSLNEDEHTCCISDRADTLAIYNEEISILIDSLTRLPYQQKEVILLHLHGSMTFKQIAKNKKISINTAKSQYRYGLEKLRSLMKKV